MSADSPKGVFSPSVLRGSLLDRVQKSGTPALSEIQSEVDGLVSHASDTVADGKTMACLFGAGLAGKFIRLGTLSAAGSSWVPWIVRGLSHATALAGESAVYAGMERGFNSLEGHSTHPDFLKAWAGAAINLGSIKIFGGAFRDQNLILQHLLTDGGMVAGQHLGSALNVTERPQGSLARQLLRAEGMNLGMKGSLSLLHGLSPQLGALERSVDLTLKTQERGLNFSFPGGWAGALAGEGVGAGNGSEIESPYNMSEVKAEGSFPALEIRTQPMASLGHGDNGSGEEPSVPTSPPTASRPKPKFDLNGKSQRPPEEEGSFASLLSGASSLSAEDAQDFARFVLDRLPKDPDVLRSFALPRDVTSLWSAFSWFCRRFSNESETGLKAVFREAGVFPSGGNHEKPLTYEMLILMRQVKADALYYLDRLRKLPELKGDAPLSPMHRLDPNRLQPREKYDLSGWKELRTPYPELNEETLLRSYFHMLKERVLTQKIYMLYASGNEFAFAVTDAGHEIHGTAAAQAFHHEVTHREAFAISPHYRSGTLVGMWAELQGYPDFFPDYIRQQLSRVTDPWSKGRQTASHFNDARYQILPGQSEVGRNLSKAVGYARALQQKGHRDAVVYAEIGDGSMALSDLHEAMTGATLMGFQTRSLPVVVGVMDNQMAISVEPSAGRALVDLQAYAKAFGAEFYRCDGNDYLDVYRTYREATRKARTEQKPAIIWVQNLSRLNNHSSAAQFEFDFKQHDSLLDIGEALVQEGLLEQGQILRRNEALNLGGFFGNYALGELGTEAKRSIDETWARIAEEPSPTLEQTREDVRLEFPVTQEPPLTGRPTQIIINGAIRTALRHIIEENPLTWVNGQDTGMKGGVMQATAGLWELFPRNVTDAPINEPAIVSIALGFALHEGAIAFPEIQFGDYSTPAYHWMVYAGNLLWTSGGTRKINLNLRLPVEPGIYGAVYHSTPLEGFMASIPGLTILSPSTTRDAYGLIRSAAEYAGPVLIFEPKALYRKAVGDAFPNEPTDSAEAKKLYGRISIHRGIPEIPRDFRVPLGQAVVRKTGKDLTLVTWGLAHYEALKVLDQFRKHDIDVELIDLRTLVPPDMETVLKSVRKTGCLLVAHQDRVFASLGREIQGQVHEAFVGRPVVTQVLGMEPVPGIPQSKSMEDAVMVGGEKILEAARKLMGR